jgi:3-methyladenine DNA glycosylase AlkD
VDVSDEQRRLLAQIEAAGDPHYARLIQRNIPSSLGVHGLRISDVRRIVSDWRRSHQDVAPGDLHSLVQELWRGPSREERLVALELLRVYPRGVSRLEWADIDGWRRELDNWELTDFLGLYVVGPWVALKLREREEHLWDLLDDENVWSRRLSLVSAIGVERVEKDAGFPTLSLGLVDHVKAERHPLIVKAVSWALRDLAKRYPEQVSVYLADRQDALAPQVLREVRNKLKTGRKDGRPSR